MASGFWYLKDGRGFARKIQAMIMMMEEIHSELKMDNDAIEFANYLSKYIPTENHELNGYGGFYHKETKESVLMEIDFREFTKENQNRFWRATQNKTNKLIRENNTEKEIIISLLKELLDMNKRINIGEDPMELNHMRTIKPPTGLEKGPGW